MRVGRSNKILRFGTLARRGCTTTFYVKLASIGGTINMIAYKFGKCILLGYAASTILWVAAPSPGRAAEAAQADSSTSSVAANEAPLEDIIVTAQRRAERLQDVPITITNLSADQLAEGNASSLGDIQLLTPGFRLDNHAGLYQPTIRGISTSITCVSCGSSVGIYVDGFYVPHPVSTDFQLLDVQSVSVLKGPQGTLFGRNTVGGAIQVNTFKPSTDTSGIAQVSYGSFNTQQYQAYVTTGLSDNVAVDFAGSLSKGNGWVTNIADDDDRYGQYENVTFRTGLKIDVTKDFSLLFRYQHASMNDPTGILFVPFVLNGKPLAFGAQLPGALLPAGPRQVSDDQADILKSHSDAGQLTATWDLSFGTLTSYSQYRTDQTPTWYSDYDFTNIPLLALDIPDFQRTTTQEFLLTSKPGGRLQWTTGVFYFDTVESYDNVTDSSFGGPFIVLSTTRSDDESVAVYGDATYEVVDDLFLTAGVRYNDDRVRPTWILPGSGETELNALVSHKVTSRAVLRYALNNESNVYASFSQGYKAAIYDTGGAVNRVPVKPENMNAFEVGYKFAVSSLSVDLSSFYYDYTNEQLASEIISSVGLASVITNAASSHIYGSDAEVHYNLFRAFEVNAGAEWLHATFRNFPDAPGFSILPNGLEPTTEVNASGYHMARSPDFTANFGAAYTAPVPSGKLVLSGNVYYTSKFYFDFAQQLPQDHYTTLGLRAAWTDPSDRYVLAIEGNNVTNAKYYTSAQQSIYGSGALWAEPANVQGSIRVKF
jgi:iron complex outermembrane receptor protein